MKSKLGYSTAGWGAFVFDHFLGFIRDRLINALERPLGLPQVMFIEELTPVYENDRSYFENYDREPIRRLNLVIDRLNRRADAYAFRIVDTRVCLITDLITYVIGIAEKDPSDFLVKQGLLVGTIEYFAKSHVPKREYKDEERPFGWMQDGVFELLEDEGRLYRWRTEVDLVDASENLP